jgi:RNA polymerase sigma-70 factor (ECF subfamily)
VQHEDSGLVRRCLEGDQDACTALVDAFARMVGTVIWRATGDPRIVEDLTQETFLRVFRGLPYFDARARLSTWIYTIAHRVAVDHLRQAGRRDDGRDEDAQADRVERVPSASPDPETVVARTELDRLVREQLAELPDKYRLPLMYAAMEELDHATIGAMLGVQSGSVKTLVFRGKQMLKERIETVLRSRRTA